MSFQSKRQSGTSQIQENELSTGLLNSLDKALDQYGASVKQVVYWKFETTFGYDRGSVFSHPNEFIKTLETVFGAGAKVVEKRISYEIMLVRGVGKDSSGGTLVDLFRAARRENSDSS
jgi:hypothetical protein